MLIRANFYADALEKEHENRFHPLRLGAAAVVGLLLIAGFYWWALDARVKRLRGQTAAAQIKQGALHHDLVAANQRAGVLAETIKRRQGILRIANDRLNWGPILEKVFSSTPANVHISRLRLAHSRSGIASVHLEGRAAGERPRAESDKLRLLILGALSEHGRSVQANFTRLQEVDVAAPGKEQAWSVAEFALEFNWKTASNGK